jgi:[protein-PII] uridylyltransferase
MALLIHDLGKGHLEDHCELGRLIARETAALLHLSDDEGEDLEFLVARHLLMNHLAFRRDTSDEQLIVKFAVEVGTPEMLQMLFVLTAADLAAVGPDAWTGWKAEVLTDLYHRTMQHLAGESPTTSHGEYLISCHEKVRELLGPNADEPWFLRQLKSLPVGYLHSTAPEQIAADLKLLSQLGPDEVSAHGRYQPETHTVQFTVGTSEGVAPGVFHRLTGALTSQGLEILSAQINTLADHIVLDRFCVHDPDYVEDPPESRLDAVCHALCASLRSDAKPPLFRRTWQADRLPHPNTAFQQTRVRIDNTTSDQYTIVDVFTIDRRGLLYLIAQTLYELELSVWRAKIGTFLDQVVDVFYVTDRSGRKLNDAARLQAIRQRLIDVIAQSDTAAS